MSNEQSWLARRWPWLAVIVVALALRGYHYFTNPPVWHDEAALLVNVLGKSYGELLGPLYYSEAGPPLFMWAEKALVPVLGDSTYALRLLPFAATVAAFLVMLLIARRILCPEALLVFAVLFGCSDRLLWHGSEAKPYAIDVLVAVALLATFVRQREDTPAELTRRFLLYTLASPFLVFLSFPSCFLLGGAALALLPSVLRNRRAGVWGSYAFFGVALCGSFLALYLGPVTEQKNERMFRCWAHIFPDWERPWLVPLLALQRLTEVFRYAAEPIGNVLSGLGLVGAVALWRGGQRRLLAFLTLPAALTVVAWLMRQYPFGAARVDVFLAPAALLLVAAGVPPVIAWLRERALWALPLLGVLLLVPVGQAPYRILRPWARLDSAGAVQFVFSNRQASEPVAGTMWEHSYYFRRLGPLFRPLDPQPTEPTGLPATSTVGVAEDNRAGDVVRRLWLVCAKDENEYRYYLGKLGESGTWRVTSRREFRDVTVMRVELAEPSARRGTGE